MRTPFTATPAVLVAALVLAACGSSSHKSTAASATQTGGGATTSVPTGRSASKTHATTTSPTPAQLGCPPGTTFCLTKNTTFKAKGTPYIDANIEGLMARGQPQVKNPVVTCPQAQSYPVKCGLAGTVRIGGRPRPIKGTVTVVGVVVQTRTYAYEVYYSPTGH